jgi:hypothetical protein
MVFDRSSGEPRATPPNRYRRLNIGAQKCDSPVLALFCAALRSDLELSPAAMPALGNRESVQIGSSILDGGSWRFSVAKSANHFGSIDMVYP